MKKNLFMVAAVALFATVSCNKENIDNGGIQGGELSNVVFVAQAEQTKTALGEAVEGTRPVTWVSGDEITVNGVKFTTSDNGATASFTTTGTFAEADVYTAIYPASAGTSLTAVEISAEQNGTFASAAVSVATSANQTLSFKNVASILKFQVPENVSEVTIESDSDLAGTFPVTFSNDGYPVIGDVSGASKKITLTGSFVAGTDYYVAVLPGTHQFTVRLNGYLSKASTKDVTTKRAVITNLQTLPAPVKSSWGIIGLNNDWNNDVVMYNDLDGYSVAKNVTIKSTDEFKLRKNGSWTTTISGGITAPNTKRDGGWVNMTISEAGIYDVYTNGSNYYIMTQGKLPSEANDPGPIEITVTYAEDTNRDYIHIWSDGGEIANNMKCSSSGPFTWKVTVPAGDQQKRDYKFILKKGSGWNSYQTADSEKLCLRNPMPLQIVNNKVTHK